ncbi:MAG: GAF domain-containing sensor histidine kinase [Nitrospirae bacterium]|nr:GAF domain-containing sensor histidine kinase [Nitrospirota bacterium]MBF0542507.1 GAF domain-containing sensor histidine kinase [Nitrospirota bacterium]
MLVVCSKCEKRHEVQKSDDKLEFSCLCGELITPIIASPKVLEERYDDRDKTVCTSCGQQFEKSTYRKNTEISCSCGSLLIVCHGDGDNKKYGRRKTDQTSHIKELQNLIKTSQVIHSNIGDLDNLLLVVANITTEMLDVEGSSVILKDEAADELVFYAVSGDKASKLNNFRLKMGEGVVGKCISTLSSIIVNDTKKDEDFTTKVDDTIKFVTRSLLCVPLMVDGRCIGALEAVNKKRNERFEEQHLMLADAVACQIAIAINNCQLHQEALKREKLAAVGEAVTGIAHCVKNMLNGLQGGMYMVKSELKKAGHDINSSSFEMFSQSIKRLSDLVQDMLTYSKERKPEYEKTNINSLVKSIVDLMQTKAREKKINLRMNAYDNIDDIMIDSKGIYRAVLNLVSNAIDACNEVENAEVNVVTQLDGKEVIISIIDQGCGMDELTLASIFKAFFSTKGSKGTGLGLSVTQKIISENGGRIEVSSILGKGSTFKVLLPTEVNNK